MTDTPTAPPALFDHCLRTYRAMLAEADALPEQPQMIVYEGFLTQLITGKLNLSVPYYSSIRRSLLGMGCVRQLRRGGGTSPSQWEMIYEPNLEAFMKVQEAPKLLGRDPNKLAAVLQMMDTLAARVNEVESQGEEILAMLVLKFGAEETKA